MLERERRAQPRVLSLVVLVEVQPEAEELQRLVLAAGQLQQERTNHVPVAVAHDLELALEVLQDDLVEGACALAGGVFFSLGQPVSALPLTTPNRLFVGDPERRKEIDYATDFRGALHCTCSTQRK